MLAEQLAKESEADSEVAIARTRAIKAEKDLTDVNAGTQTLRNESRRQDNGNTTVVVPPNGVVVMPSNSTTPQR